jgi:23S rRNA (uridine2552-2'-O)-methyltransferase
MAPNLSGMSDIDQPKSVYLIELALEFSDTVLKKGGSLVAKCFEGAGIESLRGDFRDRFKRVSNFKPKASRDRSREIYIIGLEHKRNRFG